MGITLIWRLLILLVMVCGCEGTTPAASDQVVEVETVDTVAAHYWSPTWADEDTIVLSVEPPEVDPDGRRRGLGLVALDVATGAAAPVPFEWTEGCDFISDRRPRRLEDGRIGFIRDCVIDANGTEPLSIHAVDLATGASSLVAELGDPWTAEGWRTDVGWFSFRPGLEDGVVGVGSTICDGVGRIVDGSVEPLSLAVPDDPSENLADIWTGTCADAVNARLPTWSPDGRRLAVAIAPGAKARDDWSRMDAAFGIYLVEGTNTRLVTSGIQDVFAVDWAPDSRTIAVLEGTDNLHRTRTWLIDVESGCRSLLRLADGRSLEGFAFSPDGARFAGIVHAGPDPDSALFVLVTGDLPIAPAQCG